MKKLLTSLLLSLSLLACSSEPEGGQFSANWVKKHNIKSITQWITIESEFDVNVGEYQYLVMTYNKDGFKIAQEEYVPNNALTEKITYRYDNKNNLIEEASLYTFPDAPPEGIQSGKTYTYNRGGQYSEIMLYQDTLDWDEAPPMTISDLTLIERQEFHYDNDNLIEELKFQASNTRPYEIIRYEYEQDKLVKMVTVNNANIADIVVFYEYDNEENIAQTTSYEYSRGGDVSSSPKLLFAVKYDYDLEGNIAKQQEYTPQKYQLSQDEYADETVTIERTFNSLGNVVTQKETIESSYFEGGREYVETVHEYDAEGKLRIIEVTDPGASERTTIRIEYEYHT